MEVVLALNTVWNTCDLYNGSSVNFKHRMEYMWILQNLEESIDNN